MKDNIKNGCEVNMSNKTEITILWGADKIQKTYVFETEEQKTFFMKGVDEAEGWSEYEVLELYEDVKKEVFNDRL